MDNLEIVRRELEEHDKIKGDAKLVGEAVNDMEALFSLQQAHATWSQAPVHDIEITLHRIQHAVDDISDGLSKHFEFEERYMPSVFGENVMNALTLEHDEIRKKLAECKASVHVQGQGLSQERTLEYKAAVEHLMGSLITMIEGHASREQVILRMLERLFEQQKLETTR